MANKAIDHNLRNREQYVNNEVFTLNNMCNPQGKGVVFNNHNTSMFKDIETSLIPYEDNGPMESNAWDREAHSILIFGTMDFLDIDTKNVSILLLQIANFISNRKLHKNKKILQLNGFGQAAWYFISSIYKAEWNILKNGNNNRIL